MPNLYRPGALAACSLAVLAALSGCDKKSNEAVVDAASTTPAATEASLWPQVQSAVKKRSGYRSKNYRVIGQT